MTDVTPVVTVIVAEPVIPPEVAVTVAEPTALATTRPLSLIDATLAFEMAHVIVGLENPPVTAAES